MYKCNIIPSGNQIGTIQGCVFSEGTSERFNRVKFCFLNKLRQCLEKTIFLSYLPLRGLMGLSTTSALYKCSKSQLLQ